MDNIEQWKRATNQELDEGESDPCQLKEVGKYVESGSSPMINQKYGFWLGGVFGDWYLFEGGVRNKNKKIRQNPFFSTTKNSYP